MEDLEKEITKLEKNLLNNGREDFIREMRESDKSQREAKLLMLAKHRQAIVSTKAEDEELQAAKRKKNALEYPYRQQTQMNDKLCRFIHLLNKDEGLDD